MASRNRVAEILLQAGVIDELQLRSAMAHLEQWGGRLAHALVEKKFATEDAVVAALAKGLGTQQIHVGSLGKDPGALAKLDAEFCHQNAVFPVALRDGGKTLLVAVADPSDLTLVDAIGRRSRTRVSVSIAGEAEINAAIDRHYHNRERASGPPAERFKSGATLSPVAANEEFKVTDMSGKTVVRMAPTAPAPASGPSTDDVLDQLMGAPKAAFTDEELARLHGVVENQEKSGKIFRALTELLAEKGYLTPQELAARIKS